ncbi:hypothetical protein [Parendozoicomonas sp. Alg238-R29]|uniref:hypothetical protein n=1 Tax=Parendozoicomonas sp. Alg238-R29 TaxID=2993446 RepID=UPI00248D81FC|nr:hypothetical protein [Parendozoicomonas sp. Alg238-R29]
MELGVGLDFFDIDNELNDVFAHLTPKGRRRTDSDLSSAAGRVVSLINKIPEIEKMHQGGVPCKRINTARGIYLKECFMGLQAAWMSAQKRFKGNYEPIASALAKYRRRCLVARSFIFILRDDEFHRKWKLSVCKVWGSAIIEMENATQLKQACLDEVLELRTIAPEIPCHKTRRNLVFATQQSLNLALRTSPLAPVLQDQLGQLVKWINEEELCKEMNRASSIYRECTSLMEQLSKKNKHKKLEWPDNTSEEKRIAMAGEHKPQVESVTGAVAPSFTVEGDSIECDDIAIGVVNDESEYQVTDLVASSEYQDLNSWSGDVTAPASDVAQPTFVPVLAYVLTLTDLNYCFPVISGTDIEAAATNELTRGFALLKQAREICMITPHKSWVIPGDAKEKIVKGLKLITSELKKHCKGEDVESSVEGLMQLPIVNAGDDCIRNSLYPLLNQHLRRGELLQHWQLSCIQDELEFLRLTLGCAGYRSPPGKYSA